MLSCRSFRAWVAAVCIAAGCWPSLASGQIDSATARELFRQARSLMKTGQFEEACPKLEESLRLDQGMGTQFNLAHCWEKVGKTASAWAMFLDVAAAARAAQQPKRQQVARERAQALEPRLSRLRILVPEAAPDEVITRDGKELGSATWGTSPPVDPGLHTIVASAPGYETWTREIDVPAKPTTVEVTVEPLVKQRREQATAPAEDVPMPGPSPVLVDGGTSAQATWGWIAMGLGAVGVGVGAGFALASQGETSEAERACPTDSAGQAACPTGVERDDLLAHRSKASRYNTISIVSFAAGGAALVSGLVLYLTDDGLSDGDLALQPLQVPGAEGLSLRLQF